MEASGELRDRRELCSLVLGTQKLREKFVTVSSTSKGEPEDGEEKGVEGKATTSNQTEPRQHHVTLAQRPTRGACIAAVWPP